jgi:hypothetical protein
MIQNQLLVAMQSSLHSIHRENEEWRTMLHGFMAATNRSFHVVNGNRRRLAARPVGVLRGAVGGGREETAARVDHDGDAGVAAAALAMMNNAVLIPTPRNLHDLWSEYQHGFGDRKAAMLFFPL